MFVDRNTSQRVNHSGSIHIFGKLQPKKRKKSQLIKQETLGTQPLKQASKFVVKDERRSRTIFEKVSTAEEENERIRQCCSFSLEKIEVERYNKIIQVSPSLCGLWEVGLIFFEVLMIVLRFFKRENLMLASMVLLVLTLTGVCTLSLIPNGTDATNSDNNHFLLIFMLLCCW